MTTTRQPDFATEISFTFKGCFVDCLATVQFVEVLLFPSVRWDLTGITLKTATIRWPGEIGFFLYDASDDEVSPIDAHEFSDIEGFVSQKMPVDQFWQHFQDEAKEAIEAELNLKHGGPRSYLAGCVPA